MPKISPEKEEAILKLYQRGVPIKCITFDMQCSRSTLRRLAVKAGLRPPEKETKKLQITKMYLAGHQVSDIALVVGQEGKNVHRVIRQFKLEQAAQASRHEIKEEVNG